MFDEDEFTDTTDSNDTEKMESANYQSEYDANEIDSGDYMGVVQVPLSPLSQGKPINGTFQIKQVCSNGIGMLQYRYHRYTVDFLSI